MFSILTMFGAKVAIGLLAGSAVVAGGAGVAAYADLLPLAAQQVAHDSIGAPLPRSEKSEVPTDGSTTEPTPEPTKTAKPIGPDAAGPAAHGLCTAFAHGGLGKSSTAYASLASAAKGASNIATYCAKIPKQKLKVTHGPESNDPESNDPESSEPESSDPKSSDPAQAPKKKAPKVHPSTHGSAHKPSPAVHP